MHAGDEEAGRSSSDAPSRTKRAQVKNACVNCQRACKKCDSGRPCQRCVKYNLQESCVDSKRKPRKKGIKRGPYKKRKKNPDGSDAQQPGPAETARLAESPGLMGTAVAGASGSLQRTRSSRGVRSGERARPRGLLGPGMVPILQSDPPNDTSESDGQSSSSDTPLVATRHQHPPPPPPPPPPPQAHYPPRLSLHTVSSAPLPSRLLPETPTMGLTAAFGSLATSTQQRPLIPPAASDPSLAPARYPRRTDAGLPFAQTSGAIRLPPITSLVASAPSSSLSMLTDIALSSTAGTTVARQRPTSALIRPSTPLADDPPGRHIPAPLAPPPTNPPYISIPALPDRRETEQSRQDIDQESGLLQPPDDAHSRHSTTTGSDDLSSNTGDEYDDPAHLDSTMDSSINKLSRKLQNTYLDQDSSSEL
ncbi:hypothetical protein LPJ75_000395 [Coemansia sp. RSA 2598]|nr:hypothetical protein LPJ75_000395 [Coemansia sp. RSA 2598]